MKKSKLFSTISLILSGIVIAMSGLIIVHSATSQSVASTLNVTYVANNVAFTASGYYQKKTDNSTTNLVYSGDNSSTTISFAPSNTSTTKNLQTPFNSAVTLSTTDTYVLFTYVFHNDASNGGYCIKVSLTDGSTKTNVTCKYLVSDTAYVPAELSTFISSVSGNSAPTDVYITAQSTKYFYILVSVPDLSLSSSYASTALSGLVWSVVNTDVTEEPAEPVEITITFGKIHDAEWCTAFEIWEDISQDGRYQTGALHAPTVGTKIRDLTSEISSGTVEGGDSVVVSTTSGVISVMCSSDQAMMGDNVDWTQTGFTVLDSYGGRATVGWSCRLSVNTSDSTHRIIITEIDFSF